MLEAVITNKPNIGKGGQTLKSHYTVIESIAQATGKDDWSMGEFLALLPENMADWPTHYEIEPPSGLEPATPSFNTVTDDCLMINGMVVRIGGGPAKPLHAVEYIDSDGVR